MIYRRKCCISKTDFVLAIASRQHVTHKDTKMSRLKKNIKSQIKENDEEEGPPDACYDREPLRRNRTFCWLIGDFVLFYIFLEI